MSPTATALAPRGLVRVRPQGQFRHHDQAVSCRPLTPTRACWRRGWRRGLDRQLRRVRASAGIFQVFNGAGNFDADAVLCDGRRPLRYCVPGHRIKQYPCCGSTHPAIDARRLAHAHGLRPQNVAGRGRGPIRAACAYQPSGAGERARCKIQRAILRGPRPAGPGCVLSHFDDGCPARPALSHVRAGAHRGGPASEHVARLGTAGISAPRSRATTVDGRQFVKAVDIARGRTSANPLPPAQLTAKYRDCAARALDAEAVDRSLDLLLRLERLERVPGLTDVLAAGCRGSAARRGRAGAGKLAAVKSMHPD